MRREKQGGKDGQHQILLFSPRGNEAFRDDEKASLPAASVQQDADPFKVTSLSVEPDLGNDDYSRPNPEEADARSNLEYHSGTHMSLRPSTRSMRARSKDL